MLWAAMTKRLLLILAIVAVVSAGLLLWRYKNLADEQGVPPGTLDATPPAPAGDTPPPASSSGIPPVPSPAGVSPAFISFIQKEALTLNSTNVNMEAAEKNVTAQAASMGESEIRYARDLALGPENPANQRILAAYLLGRTGAKGRSALRDLILVTTNSARAEHGSIDEVKNAQAKAISLMSTDDLAEQAKKDPAAREELRRIIAEAKDSTIKKHAQRKLAELPQL